MDPATVTAIAALAVSVLAMTVATAQAVQQYLITGQLIRICDSVVYGKMPGQGRRIWEFGQFRFRVVYSIPQISLRPRVWQNDHFEDSDDSKFRLPVPDLRHTIAETQTSFHSAIEGHAARRPPAAYSAVPGEACWVSFSRTAQHSCDKDLHYEVVDGDADRCPSDLPVVPMQVSMRDVVTIALMAGLRCTDASFERKSLAMEGRSGIITTSWHPILGAIIHFAPRNHSKAPGLRIGDGTVNPIWVARLLDSVVVAGRRFDLRERMYHEAYEGYDWSSNDRSIATLPKPTPASRSSSFISSLRKRRGSSQLLISNSGHANVRNTDGPSFVSDAVTAPLESDLPPNLRPSGHDGEWTFESDNLEPEMLSNAQSHNASSPPQGHKAPDRYYQNWLQRSMTRFYKFFPSSKVLMEETDPDSFAVDLEASQTKKLGAAPPTHSSQSDRLGNIQELDRSRGNRLRMQNQQWSFGNKRGLDLLDGSALQEYIKEKKVFTSSPDKRDHLYLTWPSKEGAQADRARSNDDGLEYFGDWRDAYSKMRQERIAQWRDIVRHRQNSREQGTLEDEWEITDVTSNRSSSHRPGSELSRRSRRHSSTSAGSSFQEQRKSTRRYDARSPPPSMYARGRTRYRGRWSYDNLTGRSPSPKGRSRSPMRTEEPPFTPQHDGRIIYGQEPIVTVPSPDPVESDEAKQNAVYEDGRESRRDQKTTVRFRLDSTENSLQSFEEIRTPSDSVRDTTASRNDNIVNRNGPPTEGQTEIKYSENFSLSRPDDLRNETTVEQRKDREDPSLNEPQEHQHEDKSYPPKSVLKAPSTRFSGDSNELGEDGASPKLKPKDIPENATWTKIDRRLVSPQALDHGYERYEVRPGYVLVLRVLSRDEIENYAELTRMMRSKYFLVRLISNAAHTLFYMDLVAFFRI